MIELIKNKLSKKRQLELWIREMEFVGTSDVIKWGSEHYCNTADRLARQLREENKIRRLTDEEKIFRGYGKTKEDIWRII